jgi:20S proteasome alpha/beta subunit
MTPKPHPCPWSKHERLPARKGMTIVIGMIAQDGIVIAADREEGNEYLKNDMGKIRATFRGVGPHGWIGIGGAGDGPACDEVSVLLSDCFCAEKERTSAEAKKALIEEHRSYYEKVVLPFASATQIGCPDYALIIGCLMGQTGKCLFATSKFAVNPVDDYEAVGIGSMVARTWLGRLYERMPVVAAVKLAAYVIYQVKNSVSGCGLGTDIIMLHPKQLFGRINPAAIRHWEEAFRYFPSLERNIFGYCVGLESSPSQLLRTKPDKQSIDKGLENLRQALMQSDVEKSKQEP